MSFERIVSDAVAEHGPDNEKIEQVRALTERLSSFTARIFREFDEGTTDEAELRRRLTVLGERTNQDMEAALGSSDPVSVEIYDSLSSILGSGGATDALKGKSFAAAHNYLFEVQRYLLERFTNQHHIDLQPALTQAIDRAIADLHREPEADPTPTTMFRSPKSPNRP